MIIATLWEMYPDSQCSLTYKKPYELLIATRLAAQCTDARVNIVTKDLFKKFPTLDSLANAQVCEIEEIIKPCGLYHAKARDISLMTKALIERFGGVVPDNMDDLLSLSGVGRKTANLILGDVYHLPAVVTDTHCIRISNRLGLVDTKDPYKVETKLRQILPPDKSNDFCHRLVDFGRDVCTARSPKCESCPLKECCTYSLSR